MSKAPPPEPPSGRKYRAKKTEPQIGPSLPLANPDRCGIVVLDSTGTIKMWSEGAQALYGYAADEVLGKPLSTLFPKQDVEAGIAAQWLEQAYNAPPIAAEMRRLRKDGSFFIVTATLNRLSSGDANGDWHAEVTLHRGNGTIPPEIVLKGRSQWREHEKVYVALMSSLTSHIAVLDKQGAIVAVNDAWNRFAQDNGAPSQAAVGVGANYLDVCRRSGATCEMARRALAGLLATIAGAEREFTLEYPCHSPKVQRWFRLSATPWPVEGGAVVNHTDITQLVLAEKKLQESEQHYRAMIENEVDIVTILDEEGRVKFESPAIKRILGYAPDELVGQDVFQFIHPADIATVKEAFAEVLASHEPSKPIEFRFRHRDLGYRVVESIARNLLSNPGVQGVIVNSRDITERREAEAALRRQETALKLSHKKLRALNGRLLQAEDRERRRVSRELHDDLNQALAALAVDMGSLRNALANSPRDELDLEFWRLQSRVVKLSENVRHLAYQLHPSILDHLGLAVALRAHCEEFARREGIPVEFVHRNVDERVSQPVASCVYRVAQEALRNVAKHSKATQVCVSVVGTNRNVGLTVRDNGVGFVPASVTAGQGLGLTSMAERSRLLSGSFRVVSAPGHGTVLKLRVLREAQSE